MNRTKKTGAATAPPPRSLVNALHNSAIGIDVAMDSLACCFQWFNPKTNRAHDEQITFPTSCSGIAQFVAWVQTKAPNVILMESTSVYWLAPWQALEKIDLPQTKVLLVNARDVKAVKGRKTDQTDAQRLATLARLDACRPSFVPIGRIREMRFVGREYARAASELQRIKQRFHKCLAATGCRVSLIFGDINGKAANAILDAALTTPLQLKAVVKQHSRRLRKATPKQILDHLQTAFPEGTRQLLCRLRQEMQQAESNLQDRFQLLRQLQERDHQWISRLMSIPSVNEVAARLIFAEIGPDLSAFPNAQAFASWIGICPGNNISAGKRMARGIPKGNRYLRRVLTEVSQGIGLSKKGPLAQRFQVFKEYRGHRRAIVAIAHKLARIIFALFRDQAQFAAELLKADVLQAHRLNQLRRVCQNLRSTASLAVISIDIADKRSGEIKTIR